MTDTEMPLLTESGWVTRWPFLCAGASAAVLLAACATITFADPDLWGHLRFGLDAWHLHHLTATDPYSFTQDQAWINHEWLSEVQMAMAYAIAGTAGLALLKGTLVTIAGAQVWLALRRVDLSARMVIFAGTVAAAAGVLRALRPQLWTVMAVAFLCRWLIERRVTAIRWLPIVFVIWANCHGGWIVGIAILALWTVIEIAMRGPDTKLLAVITVTSFIATLWTPYGVWLWWFLGTTVRMGRADITEWAPLWAAPWIGTLIWSAVATTVIWAARRQPRSWPALTVLAMLGFASARVIRLVPLFVEATVILLAPVFAARWPQPSKRVAQRHAGASARSDAIAAILIAALAIVLASRVMTSSLRCIREDSSRGPDRVATSWLKSATPGRLVCFFDWGEYAIWTLGPRLRVSIDGRRETVYSQAALDRDRELVAGTRKGLDVLRDWRPEYVWLPASSHATELWLRGHGYRIDYRSDDSFVAVRNDMPRLTSPVDAPASPCFPD